MLKQLTLILLMVVRLCHAQTLPCTIVGSVTDDETGISIANAVIEVNKKGVYSTQSDSLGNFYFYKLNPGRAEIKVSRLGYETYVNTELLLISGQSNSVEIRLKPKALVAGEVVISSNFGAAQLIGIKQFTVEQNLRYANTNFDVGRLAAMYTGVSSTDDGTNHISIRGNRPGAVLWRLEGIDIPNPNHLANAGTLSDRPGMAGGGVNMLSMQMLEQTSFYTGNFDASMGNVTGGVFNMNMRKGSAKPKTTLQAGLIGLDLSTEGKLGTNASNTFLFNYRYSTVGVLGLLGVDFGGEKINFQDLCFNLNFQRKNKNTLSIFGLLANSYNTFNHKDSTFWEQDKDKLDIDYRSYTSMAGLKHTKYIIEGMALKNVLCLSNQAHDRNQYTFNTASDTIGQSQYTTNFNRLSHRIELVRIEQKWVAKMGIISNAYLNDFEWHQDSAIVAQVSKAYALHSSPYIDMNYYFNSKWSTHLGTRIPIRYDHVDMGNLFLNTEFLASLKFQPISKISVNAYYSQNSQQQDFELRYRRTIFNDVAGTNINLSPTQSASYGIDLGYNFAPYTLFTLQLYQQMLSNIPLALNAPFYSAINEQESSTYLVLINNGTAQNKGVEIGLQHQLHNNFYYNLNASIFNSTYSTQQYKHLNTRFNNQYVVNAAFGYERPIALSQRNKLWGFGLRAIYSGGARYLAVDSAASKATGSTVYNNQSYDQSFDPYFRLDGRLYFRTMTARGSRFLSLDFQNMSNKINGSHYYYDALRGGITRKNQLGLIPVISWRIEF